MLASTDSHSRRLAAITSHLAPSSVSSSSAGASSNVVSAPPTATASVIKAAPTLFVMPPLSPAVQKLLNGYTDLVPIHVAWGDQDAYQHVNNVRYISWCETARLYSLRQMLDEYLKENPQAPDAPTALDFQNGTHVGPILKSIYFNFQSPVVYPDCVIVGTRLQLNGKDRFSVRHRMVSLAQERVVGEGEGVIVAFSYDDQTKADVPDVVRRAIEWHIARQKASDDKATVVKPTRPSTNFA